MNYLIFLAKRYGYTRLAPHVGISAKTLERQFYGLQKITPNQYAKIYNYYRRYTYRMYKSRGLSSVLADRYRGATPERFKEISAIMESIAGQISEYRKVTPGTIYRSLKRTKKTMEEIMVTSPPFALGYAK